MTGKAVCVLISATVSLVGGLAAQSESALQPADSKGRVFLNETFEGFQVGRVPEVSQLQRANMVTVVDGGGRVGSGKAARFEDSDTSAGGAMEFNIGDAPLSSMYVEFDALNNDMSKGDKSSTVIFGVGPWGGGKSLVLNAKAKRAFGFEMYQQKYLKLRVGNEPVVAFKYAPKLAFNVKIWVNDHDQNPLPYIRPDSGQAASLNPDSVVIWVDDALIGKLKPEGCAMNGEVTKGNAVVGRIGFSSASTKVADFLIDNLHVEDPSGDPQSSFDSQKDSTSPSKSSPAVPGEATPRKMAGAETISYRDDEDAMNLFVYKPKDWKATDKRSAFLYFFGGGWTKGTPEKSASIAAWAASQGMVGIAPDYRTKNRFGTSPHASVDDGRAAFDWVLKHADQLGIDPARIAVGGTSAGGHVALWTAIQKAPPGSSAATSPKSKPAAVFLQSAVTDTSPLTGYTPRRFGDDATALSPVDQLDTQMPPMLIFHAANDDLVHYGTAVAMNNKLQSAGNACELVTVPVGGHGFSGEYPNWKTKVRTKLAEFFKREKLLPSVR